MTRIRQKCAALAVLAVVGGAMLAPVSAQAEWHHGGGWHHGFHHGWGYHHGWAWHAGWGWGPPAWHFIPAHYTPWGAYVPAHWGY